MAQDQWTLQEKGRKVKNEPAHGPPLQARVAAANRTVSQLANMLVPATMILAHMEWTGGKAQSKMNGGKIM